MIYLYTYESDWLVDLRVVAAYKEEGEIMPFLNLLETQVNTQAFSNSHIRLVFDETKFLILNQ